MSNVIPLGDKLVVKPILPSDTTPGGLYVPEHARERPQQAEVREIGSEVKATFAPVGLAVGETVLIGKYAGTEVEVDGETIVVIREEDILGVVRATGEEK
jgi:chaperonin GroES